MKGGEREEKEGRGDWEERENKVGKKDEGREDKQ